MWTYNYTDNELYHHGVKGMKWGERKAQEETQRETLRQKMVAEADREYNLSDVSRIKKQWTKKKSKS